MLSAPTRTWQLVIASARETATADPLSWPRNMTAYTDGLRLLNSWLGVRGASRVRPGFADGVRHGGSSGSDAATNATGQGLGGLTVWIFSICDLGRASACCWAKRCGSIC